MKCKKITQKECIDILETTPFPRSGGELRFILRFMIRLNDLAKSRGYRLFYWSDYFLRNEERVISYVGSWILTNIESLSQEMLKSKGGKK